MKSNLMKHTVYMTVVNLIMRSINISFNAYLTKKTGAAGMGLFQLIMSVYSLAVTFSCGGIKLATTRITVKTIISGKYDINNSLKLCLTYAGICGCIIGFILFGLSDIIASELIDNTQTVFPLKMLSLSLPFVAMSSSLGGFFTAIECVPQYSCIQLTEQLFKFGAVYFLMKNIGLNNTFQSCLSIVTGMTASEIFSFLLSLLLKKIKNYENSNNNPIPLREIIRIAVPDAAGTIFRSILLTAEHLMIPKCLKRYGTDSVQALSSYGCIHGMTIPVILFPSAILSSLSALLIPNLSEMFESGDSKGIRSCVIRTLKRTALFSLFCSVFFFIFSTPLSELFCKTKEAAKYIRILSPLVPVMYTDMITDGLLKGLDRQVESMKFNILDSALCVIFVRTVLPLYSIKGYLFIIYFSEILNFALSINLLKKICNIRCFQEHEAGNSRLFQLKKCSVFPAEYEYQAYPGPKKHSQDL